MGRLPEFLQIMRKRVAYLLQLPLARNGLFAKPLDLRFKRFARGGLFGLLPLELPNLDLRSQQRGGALFERGLGASKLIACRNDLLLRVGSLRLDLLAQRGQFSLCRRARSRPQRANQLTSRLAEIGRQIRMLDAHPALLAQFRPELAEHRRRRAHGAASYQVVEAIGGWGDAEAKEQQRADLAIELARLREFDLQALDIGRQADLVGENVGHGRKGGGNAQILQRISHEI
ncbi:hypothetical protein AWB74_08866 [Caballeronia arvi]|uniref:Uncharacterized protein n=1 Tax=Caballeronia arvi TaxID=1777135 RepID=A0A158L6T8_9BURK|nr:hypothetical protein AWB74_08866 [Caballeronia arvi]